MRPGSRGVGRRLLFGLSRRQRLHAGAGECDRRLHGGCIPRRRRRAVALAITYRKYNHSLCCGLMTHRLVSGTLCLRTWITGVNSEQQRPRAPTYRKQRVG